MDKCKCRKLSSCLCKFFILGVLSLGTFALGYFTAHQCNSKKQNKMVKVDKRHGTFASVGLIITRTNEQGKQEILLQERSKDIRLGGLWTLAVVGHIDANEDPFTAAVREGKEEISIDIYKKDLVFNLLQFSQIPSLGTYSMMYFSVKEYKGIPKINEPNKCINLQWFAIDDLPQNIMDLDKKAIAIVFNNKIADEGNNFITATNSIH